MLITVSSNVNLDVCSSDYEPIDGDTVEETGSVVSAEHTPDNDVTRVTGHADVKTQVENVEIVNETKEEAVQADNETFIDRCDDNVAGVQCGDGESEDIKENPPQVAESETAEGKDTESHVDGSNSLESNVVEVDVDEPKSAHSEIDAPIPSESIDDEVKNEPKREDGSMHNESETDEPKVDDSKTGDYVDEIDNVESRE